MTQFILLHIYIWLFRIHEYCFITYLQNADAGLLQSEVGSKKSLLLISKTVLEVEIIFGRDNHFSENKKSKLSWK